MSLLKVAIIGSGSAGQSASIFLRQNGHSVRVFEKVADPKPVGAGFLLQPTAFIPLKRMRVFDEIVKYGSKVKSIHAYNHKNRTILDLKYTDLHENLYALGLNRGALYSCFMKRMKEEGVEISNGVHITEMKKDDGSKQTKLSDSEGNDCGSYDLVIVADGSRSALREKYHSEYSKVRPYKWGTLFAIVEDKDKKFTEMEQLNQILEGSSKMMGILPTGYRVKDHHNPYIVEGDSPEAPLVTMFWSLHSTQVENWNKGDFNLWKETVHKLSPLSKSILEVLKKHGHLWYANYFDVRMKPYYSPKFSNVVFIGDCAHAMSPVLGQGVNLAIQDAMLLSDSIKSHPNNVEEALKEYSSTRKPILSFYQNVSRWANPWFQSSNIPGFHLTRDLFFAPVTTAFRFLKDYTLLIQAGSKKGFFDFSKKNGFDFHFWDYKDEPVKEEKKE